MNHDQVNGFLATKIDFHRVTMPWSTLLATNMVLVKIQNHSGLQALVGEPCLFQDRLLQQVFGALRRPMGHLLQQVKYQHLVDIHQGIPTA